ncbi:MAG TPA: hypothetical protein PK385_04920 [Spirochaetota bacterium]|nr:hypothetical protein [Spirochaetota bacterium]HOS33001.1 hypothetical protein [Spirochaetota bacterium]HOS55382.1 hypothetical protein [Spirochaetota bacterium]HPK62362.1 hypothetical protein [Spirochaetota bacterium]HQF77893.1 hypothetical protein [Spirochaetota bacterium]
MKKIIIFFALPNEANSFLYRSKIKFSKISSVVYNSEYKDVSIKVFITGVGKRAVENFFSNSSFDTENSIFIKAGTCAVLDDDLDILRRYVPLFISDGDEVITIDKKAENYIKDQKKITLAEKKVISLEKALNNKDLRQNYAKTDGAFADMECYYVARNLNGAVFIPLLVGTDYGYGEVYSDFLSNLDAASKLLSESLIDIIENICAYKF